MGAQATVLLLHGQPGRARDWDSVRAALDGRVTALAIDRPGWDGQTAAGGLELSARAALAALDRAGIARATVAGHSYGAAVAAWLATIAPERTQALVLVAPAANRAGIVALDRLLAAPGIGYLASAATLSALSLVVGPRPLRRRIAARLAIPNESLDGVGRWLRSRSVWSSFVTEQRALFRDLPELEARLGALQVPATVVIGKRDPIVPPRSARLLATQIPHARLVEPDRAHHALVLQAPARIAELILDAAAHR